MTADPQRLFASAVPQYARYRAGYPSADVAVLARALGLERTGTVLDVGCGTGQLTLPLARHAAAVIAVDPVPAMLGFGRRAAAAAHVDNVTWVEGAADSLEELTAPGVQAATFAASFHWTDRPRVLGALDRLLAPAGSVAVLGNGLDDAEDPDWARALGELRRSYLGADLEADARHPQDGHRTVLENSAFSDVRRLVWEWTRELTVEQAVGLQFTYSFSTPALFGARAASFAEQAREVVLALHPGGRVVEPLRVEVLVASRPGR